MVLQGAIGSVAPFFILQMVHILTPYRTDKNLGAAYNAAISLLPDSHWACVTDIDICFLTPDAGVILEEYAARNPEAGILTCFTNRVSHLSRPQLLEGVPSENPDIKYHISLAEKQRELAYSTTVIDRDISGMLMLMSKKTWQQFPFPENGKAIGVDTYYGRRIRAAGLKILRMDGLYIFHIYRFMQGVNDKRHLL